MAEIVGAAYGNLVYATLIDQTERQVVARGMARGPEETICQFKAGLSGLLWAVTANPTVNGSARASTLAAMAKRDVMQRLKSFLKALAKPVRWLSGSFAV